MSFATFVRNRNTERLVALFSTIAVLMSLMAIYAQPAQAHHPEITAVQVCGDGPGIEYAAESWLTTGASGSGHSDISIEARVNDGDWVEVASGAFTAENDYSFSGTFDGDDLGEDISNSTVTVRATANGPWDNGQGGGESRETSVTIAQDCPDADPVDPVVGVDLSCRMDGGLGPVTNVTFTIEDPDGVVQSVSIVGPGSFTAEVDSSDGWAIELMPGDYTWSANLDASYTGDPISDDLSIGEDCLSCPIPGAIDLSNSGHLGSYRAPTFDTWGGPVTGVNIPEGFYNITLASYDSHSEKAGQMQTQEIWALSNGPNGGTWQSPFSPDLAESTNFEIYTTVGGGPVFVPEIQDLYTVHGAIGGSNANSVQPVCAQFEPVTQEVEVDVVASSCQVNDLGEPVGSIDISIDPDSQATVRIYDDAAKTADDLVAEVTSSDSVPDLSPGTYYWEAEPAAGYTLTGPSEGEVTIQDCEVTVAMVATCEVQDVAGVGLIEATISTPGSVTVEITDSEGDVVATLTESGTVSVPEGETYQWSASAQDGFVIAGADSGELDVEECTESLEIDVVGVCEGNVPMVSWNVTPVNVDADQVTVIWNDIDPADPLYSTTHPLEGTMLWPGTVVDDGEVVDWPGWVLVDGTWTQAADGYEATRPQASVTFGVNPTATMTVEYPGGQPECDGPPGEIIVEKLVEAGSQTFEFTFDTDGFTLGDDTLAHGQSSSSGPLTPGDGYSVSEVVPPGWTQVSAVCDDGSDPSNIDVSVGEQVTCTVTNRIQDEVLASIQVSVEGSCELDGDEGEGIVEATIAVADGATVVVRDSDDDIVGTLTSDGTITVPEGATYTWEATPSAGFEFPPGFDSSGSIVIERCSDPEELPFTGLNMDGMAAIAAGLLGTGIVVVTTLRRREEG